MLSKALPKIYGDKLTTEVIGRDGGSIGETRDPRELARPVAFRLTAGMHAAEEAEKAKLGKRLGRARRRTE